MAAEGRARGNALELAQTGDQEDRQSTKHSDARDARGRSARRAPPTARPPRSPHDRVARVQLTSRAVPSAERAPRRPPPPVWGAARARAARRGSERRRRAEERDGANKGPRAQERAERAESPHAACIAQRRTREGSLARVALDVRSVREDRRPTRGEMIHTTRTLRALLGCGGESRQTA